MNSIVVVHIVRFVLLILTQVLVLSEIQGIGGLNVLLYPMFILLLPLRIPHWLLVVIGFFTGLVVDIFMNTPGVNSFATTSIAFLRPFICKIIAPRGGYDLIQSPNKATFGIEWFAQYAGILLFIHIFLFFLMSYFDVSQFFLILMNTVLSFVVSYLILILSQYVFNPKS